ncbi:RNA polymerase III RPC4-domain-containing protein [Phyllosticta capitalensis]|uniref:RNA polymerase III RPC4-domain-containing protein n=1 Tax=Phyllosticta capitalensis TaxID=121624 RepID=A0ABR1YL69_9PEZI
MPPKRGGRAKRGTSTRGRGAKAASTTRAEATTAEPQAQDEESLFVPKDEPAPLQPPESATNADVDMTDAAQAGPATTNTATEAADTAAGASEPDTASNMASAATSAVPSAAASPAPSGIAPAARGGKKSMARMPTFKGRRSKEEREQKEAEAEAKRRERMAELNAEARAANPGRGRGDRGRGRGRGDRAGRGGRGGFMGQNQQREEGIFTDGWATGIDQSRLMIHRGKSSGAGFSSGSRRKPIIKKEGGGDGEAAEAEDGGYISSDPEADSLGPRIDVDRINIKDEFEDELEVTGEGPAQNSRPRVHNTGLAPVRLQRREHHNAARKIVAEAPGDPEIKMEDGTSSKKGKQKAKDVQVTGEQVHWRGAWGWEDEDGAINIKDEPTEDSTIPTNVPEAPAKDPPSSPELSRKTKPRIKARKPRWGEFVAHTEEEKAEQARILAAQESVARELGTVAMPREPANSTPRDADGDTAMNDGTPQEDAGPKQESIDNRQDRVYLFQFPPVLPSLMVKEDVKPEPTSPTHPHDVDAPAAESSSTANKQKQPGIKIEAEAAAGLDQVSPDLPTVLASGKVGKLRVHKSGRTTLDWGGTSLELHAGMEASFLQDIVIAKTYPPEERVGRDAGQAMSFGRVFGKFVVTPDFEEIVG